MLAGPFKIRPIGSKREPCAGQSQDFSASFQRITPFRCGHIAENSCTGILHVTNSGACSWFEFAEKIFELSGIRPVDLKPISSEDYVSPAPRPRNSRLSNRAFLECGFDPMPPWEDALRRFLHDSGITADG